MGKLENKVVIVTGAGRGIGREYALGAAREGAKVVLAGRRLGSTSQPETLEHVAAMIRQEGGEALPVLCDVRQWKQVEAVAEQAATWGGRLDAIVANAGMYFVEAFSDTTVEQWGETIEGFLNGAFYCAKAVLPYMRNQGSGSIINMGSDAAVSQDPRAFGYGVARAATTRLTVKLATELKADNIAVNALDPDFTLTERVQEVLGENFDRSRALAADHSVPAMVWLAGLADASFTGQIVKGVQFGKTWP